MHGIVHILKKLSNPLFVFGTEGLRLLRESVCMDMYTAGDREFTLILPLLPLLDMLTRLLFGEVIFLQGDNQQRWVACAPLARVKAR